MWHANKKTLLKFALMFASSPVLAEIKIESPVNNTWANIGEAESSLVVEGSIVRTQGNRIRLSIGSSKWEEKVTTGNGFKFSVPTSELSDVHKNEIKVTVLKDKIEIETKSVFVNCCSPSREGLLESFDKDSNIKLELGDAYSEIKGAGVFVSKGAVKAKTEVKIIKLVGLGALPKNLQAIGRGAGYYFSEPIDVSKISYTIPTDWRPRNEFAEVLPSNEVEDFTSMRGWKGWSAYDKNTAKNVKIFVKGARNTMLIEPTRVEKDFVEFKQPPSKFFYREFIPVYVVPGIPADE